MSSYLNSCRTHGYQTHERVEVVTGELVDDVVELCHSTPRRCWTRACLCESVESWLVLGRLGFSLLSTTVDKKEL